LRFFYWAVGAVIALSAFWPFIGDPSGMGLAAGSMHFAVLLGFLGWLPPSLTKAQTGSSNRTVVGVDRHPILDLVILTCLFLAAFQGYFNEKGNVLTLLLFLVLVICSAVTFRRSVPIVMLGGGILIGAVGFLGFVWGRYLNFLVEL